MTDTIATRPIESGWTKEAQKAEREAKRAAHRAQAKLASAEAWTRVRAGGVATWGWFVSHFLLALGAGCSIAGAAWEWSNTGRGWERLYPGMGVIIYIGAAAAVALYFVCFRRAREEARSRSIVSAVIWGAATAAAALVCLWGVWSAVVANSIVEQRKALESRKEFAALKIDRDTLADKLELQGPDFWKAAAEKDQQVLDALVGTAKGTYDMPDLDERAEGDPPEKHGCPAPPKKFTMARLCAQANGGIDPFDGQVLDGKRLELEQDHNGLKIAEADQVKLDGMEKRIASFVVKTGDEQLEAMKTFAGNDMSAAERYQGIMYALVSMALLLPFGLVMDWVLEQFEARLAASRAAKIKAGLA